MKRIRKYQISRGHSVVKRTFDDSFYNSQVEVYERLVEEGKIPHGSKLINIYANSNMSIVSFKIENNTFAGVFEGEDIPVVDLCPVVEVHN